MLGPKDLNSAQLKTSNVGKSVRKEEVMSVPRTIDGGMYILDTSLSIGSTYIASLELMLRGHGLGSMIWWRWRIAAEDVGYWITEPRTPA